MKKLAVLISIAFILCSCSKSSTSTTPRTKTQYLTDHSWKYDELFNNYNLSNSTLVYKRGKPNNLYDLDGLKVTFKTDGTFVNNTTNPVGTQTGTWTFLSNETILENSFNGGATYSAVIIMLDEKNYIFYDAASNSYGKLIPY